MINILYLAKARISPKMVPVRRTVTRDGTTFPTTVWVLPEEAEQENPKHAQFDIFEEQKINEQLDELKRKKNATPVVKIEKEGAFTPIPNTLKDAPAKQVTFAIMSKGQKWFKGKAPGKSYEVDIAINEASSGYEVGKQYSFSAVTDYSVSKYGSKTTVYPLSAKEVESRKGTLNTKELERWLGYVEEKATSGYLYANGVEKLRELHIEDHPELAARLKEARTVAKKAGLKADAEKWLGYIKENLSKYWYRNGEASVLEAIGAMDKAGIDSSKYRDELNSLKEKFEERTKPAPKKEGSTGLSEAPFHLRRGSGYGEHEYSIGEVIRNRSYKEGDGSPKYYTVTSAIKRYFREDGMSFGVGDESGYVYAASARAATPEETAIEEEKRAKKEVAKQKVVDRENIAKLIRDTGDRPDGSFTPEGEMRYINSDSIVYGGGSWFVLGPEWIWYVKNNGGDGDNWGNNNIKTGGAGAIGWRVPATPELAEKIIKLT